MEKLYGSVFPGYLSHTEVFLDNAILDTGALWAIGRPGPGSQADVPALDADIPRIFPKRVRIGAWRGPFGPAQE